MLLDAGGLFGDSQSVDIGGDQVLLGDMDNDGDLDAVVLSQNSMSRILVNDGHGQFQSASLRFGPTNPTDADVGDIDGDGLVDLVIGDGASNEVNVWRNAGNHQFTTLPGALVPGKHPSTVNVADLDNDGDFDLILASNANRIFLNDGLGNFPNAAQVSGSSSVVADFDGDADIDILNRSGVLFFNDGSGDFPSFISNPLTIVPKATRVGDFDGDGDLDVYESNQYSSDGNGHIWFNDGTGHFTDSGQILGRKSDGHEDRDTAVGDIDLDGDLDLIVARLWDPETYLGSTIWVNNGTGRFAGTTGPLPYPHSVALGDVDADGDLELVGDNGNYLELSKNRTVTTVELPASGGSFQVVRSGDDLVVRHVGGAEIFREAAAGIKTLRIQGSATDDRIDASAIAEIAVVLDGFDGNDSLIGGSSADTIDGGNGDDSIVGNGGADEIFGGAGNDWLGGNMGNDRLDGGDDQDTLSGGAGHDELRGGNGNDAMNGSSGNDRMYGEEGSDVLRADAGNDLLDGGTQADTLVGDDGNDSILGGDGDDLLRGVAGRDTLDGGNGHDDLRGGADNDSVLGSAGNDTLNGNIGHDTLLGGVGDDAIAGGVGNDLLNGSAGRDTLLGGVGTDTLLGGADADILLGQDGDDYLDGQGDSHDTLNGGSGANTIYGLATEIDLVFTRMADWQDRS